MYLIALARFLRRQRNILWYRWSLVFRCVYALMWKSYRLLLFSSIEILPLNHCYVQDFFCVTCIECWRRWVANAMHFWSLLFSMGSNEVVRESDGFQNISNRKVPVQRSLLFSWMSFLFLKWYSRCVLVISYKLDYVLFLEAQSTKFLIPVFFVIMLY